MARRYRAPSQNGELLIDPPFDAVPRLIEENRKKLDRDDVRIGRFSLTQLRKDVRSATPRSIATDSPLILTGHQPEFFHPGVWVKNFAAAGLAKRLGGYAVHLSVDNDVVHSTSVAVPHFDPDPAAVLVRTVPFDRTGPETAYEYRTILDPEWFDSLPDRLAREFDGWPFRPLLADRWIRAGRSGKLHRLTEANREQIEVELGCIQGTIRVSDLTRDESWRVFSRHLLADAARFAAVHNAALAAYRRENKLRSRTHPFPDLAPNEAPFWVLDEDGKRKRCLVPYTGDPKSLRPRALTLTLFARLILGDFFIHGIGGAKYDEVTDRIIRDYFGIDPPAYQVVTGTLHLPFPPFPHTGDDVKRLKHLRRDLDWNPHRHLTTDQRSRLEIKELLARRETFAADRSATKAARRQLFRDRRTDVEALRPLVSDRAAEIERALAAARTDAFANSILLRRDYAWVLYPRDVLVPFLKRVQDQASGNRR